MASRSGFPIAIALTAVVAFGGGLATSALLRSEPGQEASASTSSTPASSSTGGPPQGSTLPLAQASLPRTPQDLAAALQEAVADPSTGRRIGRIWWLSEAITPANARAIAEESVKARLDPQRETLLLSAVFFTWGRTDAASAIAYAQNLGDTDRRKNALLSILSGWALKDFDAAVQWAEQSAPGNLRREARQRVILAMAESDPTRALDFVERRGVGNESFAYASWIFPELTRRDPSQAAARALDLPAGRFRQNAARAVAERWAESDHEAALRWAEQLPRGQLQRQTVSSVMQKLARTNFDAAYAWLQKQPDGSARNRLLQEITFEAAGASPENALKLVDLVPSTSAQDGLLQTVARRWAQTDTQAAREWAEAQTDSSVRRAAISGLVAGMTQDDPEIAAAYVTRLSEGERAGLVANVASNWASQNPAAAAQWAASLPDARSRTEAIGNVMSTWSREEPAQALKWFEAAAPTAGTERDTLVTRFTGSLANADPGLAVQLARTIQDPKLRNNSLQNVAMNWLREDPVAATAWITSSELPESTRRQLLERARRSR